jgi:hypothetical protein
MLAMTTDKQIKQATLSVGNPLKHALLQLVQVRKLRSSEIRRMDGSHRSDVSNTDIDQIKK